MEAIVQRSAGLDVHKKVIVVTILLEQPDGFVFSINTSHL
jgi:hypothetical protein